MKPLFTQQQYDNSKSEEKLPCECYVCQETFYSIKKKITQELKTPDNRVKFCSKKCYIANKTTSIYVSCSNCSKTVIKLLSEIKRNKNHFCCQSCSATYNNKHKMTGYRRSKLEKWIEEQLLLMYPHLHIDFNKTDAVGSELDIYIPSINLAFELNGIFHYEPIYGIKKLNKVQDNDISKSKACHDNKIDLCIIDTSQQKYVKPHTSKKYLEIIINIIEERINVA
jgi:transposase-like protein